MAEAGELNEVPDEEDRTTYHRICRRLEEAGYEHYEISNFARKDPEHPDSPSPYRSRHNSLYWDMSDYIGAGLGASGFVGGVRYKNITDIEQYISEYSEPEALKGKTGNGDAKPVFPLEEEHVNSAFDNISEAVFTGLRRREGITYEEALAAYRRGTETDPSGNSEDRFWEIFADAKEEAADYAARGLLIIDSKGLRLTEQGIDISNSIMSLFV
jgi:oxygen-independent coproporphyrinogen-3 oxidase